MTSLFERVAQAEAIAAWTAGASVTLACSAAGTAPAPVVVQEAVPVAPAQVSASPPAAGHDRQQPGVAPTDPAHPASPIPTDPPQLPPVRQPPPPAYEPYSTPIFAAFPRAVWRQTWSNNPQERLIKEIRRQTDVVGIFPNRDSIIRLVGAVPAEQNEEWTEQRRHMGLEVLAECHKNTGSPDSKKRQTMIK